MKVWIVSHAYRLDYEIEGVYATQELAEAACERGNHALGEKRHNPSWTLTVSEHEVQIHAGDKP